MLVALFFFFWFENFYFDRMKRIEVKKKSNKNRMLQCAQNPTKSHCDVRSILFSIAHIFSVRSNCFFIMPIITSLWFFHIYFSCIWIYMWIECVWVSFIVFTFTRAHQNIIFLFCCLVFMLRPLLDVFCVFSIIMRFFYIYVLGTV